MTRLIEPGQRRKIGVEELVTISGSNGVVSSAINTLFLFAPHSEHHFLDARPSPSPPSPNHYVHLSYQDLSIHLSKATIHSFSNQLIHHPEQTGFAITFLNITHSLSKLVLGTGARRILTTPNAGGSSIWSEALSFELLYRLVGATLVKTEMELTYSRRGSPITDYACQVAKATVGVSVTRAMAFKRPFEKQDATRLLIKKLKGINMSSTTVTNCTFARQILHVWTQSGHDAATVRRAWRKLPLSLCSNTIILVTSVNSPLLFFEKQAIVKERKPKPSKKWY
jgi:hypothetical protein